ncbi:MAG: S-layer homology domain-containing protein, partial [Alicyclobacillus sp.]|nr:S-layer homology domain-containing protein [Alicyclobacillus sp.]
METEPGQVRAQPVPPAAVQAYQTGMRLKGRDNQAALRWFAKAAALAPTWEPPVYEEGVLLSVSRFSAAVPYLLKAAQLNPKDNSVWNILGWGYYQAGQFDQARASFSKQLAVKPAAAAAWWGIANVEMNSRVRHFAAARAALGHLMGDATYGSRAKAALAKLPPDEADPAWKPDRTATMQDAVVLLLSYRSDIAPTSSAYVAWANAHGVLDGLLYQADAPVTRQELALMLAHFYGIDRFEYLRPFRFRDTGGLPVDLQMTIQSLVANGILQPVSADRFDPAGHLTRAQLALVVAHANQTMKNGLNPARWLAPPPPPVRPACVYMLNNDAPDPLTQLADAQKHHSELGAVGLTEYPWASAFPNPAGQVRLAEDGTRQLLTPMSAGPAQQAELQGLIRLGIPVYLVLGNYNNLTHTSDPALAHRLLTHPGLQREVVEDIVHIMTQEKLAGITVDFENLRGEDRQGYTRFLQSIHRRMEAHGWQTMVCLPERDADDPASAYDWRALAAAAYRMNISIQDIGARRLATVVEKVLEDLSFEASERRGETVVIDAQPCAIRARRADLDMIFR